MIRKRAIFFDGTVSASIYSGATISAVQRKIETANWFKVSKPYLMRDPDDTVGIAEAVRKFRR